MNAPAPDNSVNPAPEPAPLPTLDARQCRKWASRLCSRHSDIQQQARREYALLPPEPRAAVLYETFNLVQGRTRTIRAVQAAPFLLLATTLISAYLLYDSETVTRLIFGIGIYVVIATQVWARNRRFQNQSVMDMLDAEQEPHIVPFLLERLEGTGQRSPMLERRCLRNALLRLLPRVLPQEYHGWPEKARAELLRPLSHPLDDVERTLATLYFLARRGGRSALKPIEDLAKWTLLNTMSGFTTVPLNPGPERDAYLANRDLIQRTAIECLPRLQARLAAQEQLHTLLRAAEMPAAPDTLLRSASATETPAEQLLRPY